MTQDQPKEIPTTGYLEEVQEPITPIAKWPEAERCAHGIDINKICVFCDHLDYSLPELQDWEKEFEKDFVQRSTDGDVYMNIVNEEELDQLKFFISHLRNKTLQNGYKKGFKDANIAESDAWKRREITAYNLALEEAAEALEKGKATKAPDDNSRKLYNGIITGCQTTIRSLKK